jgi:hypothetical protein
MKARLSKYVDSVSQDESGNLEFSFKEPLLGDIRVKAGLPYDDVLSKAVKVAVKEASADLSKALSYIQESKGLRALRHSLSDSNELSSATSRLLSLTKTAAAIATILTTTKL